jgi:hypothetical protein
MTKSNRTKEIELHPDYRYRAVVKRADVERKMALEINAISYDNFKDSVKDTELHDAYLKVWRTMMELQK